MKKAQRTPVPPRFGASYRLRRLKIVTDMLIRVVEDGAPEAQLPGYTIAGKPGTAKISTAVAFEEGRNAKILSFIGYLPADDPQAVVMIKLDRPDGDLATK